MKRHFCKTLLLDNYGDHLLCPRCRGENLHHGDVRVYRRKEDDTLIITVADPMPHCEVRPDEKSSNPSARRDGIAIQFWCEDCDQISELTIAQHKGWSMPEWRAARKRRDQTISDCGDATEDAA